MSRKIEKPDADYALATQDGREILRGGVPTGRLELELKVPGPGIYRFTCNRRWQVVQDMDHLSEEEALASIPTNYDASRVRWQRFSP